MKRILILVCFLISNAAFSQCLNTTSVTVTPTVNGGTATWSSVVNAQTYSIAIFTHPGNVFTGVQTVTSSTTWTFTGLNANTLYRFQIATICIGGGTSTGYSQNFTTSTGVVACTPMTAACYSYKYLKVDSMLHVSAGDTSLLRSDRRGGAIVFKNSDSNFYGWNGLRWETLGSSSNNVTPFIDTIYLNGDTLKYKKNNVVYGITGFATQDWAINKLVSKDSIYNNPTWINTLHTDKLINYSATPFQALVSDGNGFFVPYTIPYVSTYDSAAMLNGYRHWLAGYLKNNDTATILASKPWSLDQFPQLTQQYNNPSWVATLLDSKLRSSTATNNQFLRYNGTTYVPTTLGSGAYTDSLRYFANGGNAFGADPIFGTTNNRNIRLFANNLQVGTLVSSGIFVMGFTGTLPWSSGELIQANGGLLSNGNIRAYNGFIRSNPLSGTNCGEFRVGSNASWLTAYNDATGGGISLNNTLNNSLLFTPSNGAILKTPNGISFNGNNTDAFSNMRVFTSGKVAIGFNNSSGVPNQGTINNTSGAMLAVVGDDGFQNTGRFIQSGDTTYNVTSGFDLVLDAKKYGHTISFDGASLPYKDSLRVVLPNVSGNGLNGQEIVLRFGGSNGTGSMFIHKLKLLALDGTQSPIVAGTFDGDRRNPTTISVYSGETIKLHFIKGENKWWADASSVFNRGEQLLTNSGIDFAFPAALYGWTKKTILPNLSQNRNLVIDTALEYKNREAFTIVNNNNTSFSYNLTGELVYDNLGNTVTTLRNNSTAVIESINNKWVLNYYETSYRGTQTQRLAMSANIGDLFYQTNGTEGAYIYKSTGWAFAY